MLCRFASTYCLLGAVLGCATARAPEPVAVTVADRGSVDLSGYRFALPDWWDELPAQELPQGVESEGDVRDLARERFGSDTGDMETWRSAMKLWFAWYVNHRRLPVYLAHAYRAGGDSATAARIYADLQRIGSRPGELSEWYGCYLAYCAGEEFVRAGQLETARRWYGRAAEYASSEDGAVRYYADEARQRAELEDDALRDAVHDD